LEKGLNFIGGCSKLETFFLALLAVEKSNAEKLIVAVKRKANGTPLINIRTKSVKNKSPRTFRNNMPGK
jgi:hypothetical protein